jgi:hypothetical protein
MFKSDDGVANFSELFGTAIHGSPASAANSSPSVACVPSILLDRTASRHTKGRSECGDWAVVGLRPLACRQVCIGQGANQLWVPIELGRQGRRHES